ncbi:MAG: prepilin-type N-terminal cleavage/methylation domain-containing protein [Candidatus Binataceae bacterium]|nr:prepilin-type N-terminal cleavage/methylation domain-containing protein [Candidatus Binataceae bacterium]
MPVQRHCAQSLGSPCRSHWYRLGRPVSLIVSAGSGFTLIELAVVLFIMGLIMSIAMPYFGGLTSARLRSEARRLAGRANYLYDEAAAQKVVLRLNFNLDTNTYSVSRLDPFQPQAIFVPERGAMLGPVMLPSGVRIRDVTVGSLGTVTRGMVGCAFYPTGWADSAVIHLADSDGMVFTLGIAPLTGHVSLRSGDLTPNQLAAGGG